MATQTMTDEVHLINIITIAQDKLQSNFRNILNRLKGHDQKLIEQKQSMKKCQEYIIEKINSNQKQKQMEIDSLTRKIEKCFEFLNKISNKQGEHEKLIIVNENSIQKIEKDIVDMGATFDEKIGQNKNDFCVLEEKLSKAQEDIYKAYQQLLKKQDSTEVLKISREVETTKQKLQKTQKEFKHLEHKLEKMEIYNQKSQRNQTKKQVEIMKEVQEKIKKEIKMIHKFIPHIGAQSRYSSPGVMISTKNFENDSSFEESQKDASPNKQAFKPKDKQKFSEQVSQINVEMFKDRKESVLKPAAQQENFHKEGARLSDRLSFRLQEDEAASISLRNNLQKLAIAKINQKIATFEIKIKSLEDSVFSMAEAKKKNAKPQNDELIKEKINEIKPELIKLWAKCDTLDDRIVFNERKMEEKTKIVNNLLEAQKQNGIARLDEKFKQFQTEIYATLKELKTKVDAKLNCTDYEKQTMMLDERLKQICELIYSKSDKLEVKKALLFLQSKIKQIILVISEDEENQKDALLTKKQLKCMSCDKDVDNAIKFANITGRGNWDALPIKDHSPQLLGKFGMTGFGSLSKKLRKLESKELPVLKPKKNPLQPIINTTPQPNSSAQ